MMRMRIVAILAVLVAGGTLAMSEEPATKPASQPVKAEAEALAPADKLAVTTGTVTIGGQPLAYTATAGYMPLKDETGKLRANIFYVAYTTETRNAKREMRNNDGEAATNSATTEPGAAANRRPVAFLFNGGPGSAAVWLHLGTAGPRRLDIPADGWPPKAPFKLVDNAYSWLGSMDLVFIDPVSTGYSRAATPEMGKEFHGVEEDIASIGEFVRLYLTKNQRWDSPVFLAGESYGTTRAAGLADYLQQHVGVSVSGVILISSVLNFAALSPGDGNDLPYMLYLPSYTAAALYHGKIKGNRTELLEDAETFALGDYATALAKGAGLAEAQRDKTAEHLAELTGLTKAYILESDLRVPPQRFMKELLRGEGKVLGRYDSRITGDAVDPANDSADWDPSFDGYFTAYTSAFNDYVRKTLKYENDLPYEVLTGKVQPWNFNSGGWNGYLYVGDNLRNAMTHNPDLKLLVAAGTYDFATPFFSADYEINHLHLAKELRKNITQTYYPAGHMLYQEHASLEQLQKDVAAFVDGAVKK